MAEAATPLPRQTHQLAPLGRFEDAHAVDVPFLFERQGRRIGRAAIASLVSHAVLLMAFLAIRYSLQPITASVRS